VIGLGDKRTDQFHTTAKEIAEESRPRAEWRLGGGASHKEYYVN